MRKIKRKRRGVKKERERDLFKKGEERWGVSEKRDRRESEREEKSERKR